MFNSWKNFQGSPTQGHVDTPSGEDEFSKQGVYIAANPHPQDIYKILAKLLCYLLFLFVMGIRVFIWL